MRTPCLCAPLAAACHQIIFIEDPLHEDAWEDFAAITARIGKEYEVRAAAPRRAAGRPRPLRLLSPRCRWCLLGGRALAHQNGLAPRLSPQPPVRPPASRTLAQIIGDDLLCTNPSRIERAIKESACNALLLKVNQIGTVSESIKVSI